MIVGFDDPVTDEMLADIRAIDGMAVAKIVENQMAEAFAPRLAGGLGASGWVRRPCPGSWERATMRRTVR